MSMFDWVRCDADLPKAKAHKLAYQTKDFDNRLNLIVIDKEHRITIRDVNTGQVSALDYTGVLNFYTDFGHKLSYWVEWNATVVNGVVQKFVPVRVDTASIRDLDIEVAARHLKAAL